MQDGFRRALILNSIIIFVSFMVFVLSGYFLNDRLNSAGARILEMRKNLANFAGSAERLADLKNSLLEADEYDKKMELFLPVQDQLWNFPEYARSVARTNGVDLTISFLPDIIASSPTSAGSVGFSMQAQGNLSNIMGFMEELEKKTTRFWIGLDTIDLSRSGDLFSLQSQGKVFFK